jgi:membrane protein DedA with SNARE-associated domain
MPSFAELTQHLTRAAALTGPWAPVLLFAATFVEHVFPPFPGDLMLVLCAWYAVSGQLSWPMVLLFSTSGAVAGAWLDHRIGGWLGARLEAKAGHTRLLTVAQLERFEAAYRRWGNILLIGNRFLPGIRGFLFLAAGASRIPLARTLVLGGLSALIWNALLLTAGALITENAEGLVRLVNQYMLVAGALLALAAGALLLRALWRRWRRE